MILKVAKQYEELSESHHDHLIDVKTGEIIEFVDEEIEKLQKKVAEKYGYELVDHKLELYGVKKNKWTKKFILKLSAVKWMNMIAAGYLIL